MHYAVSGRQSSEIWNQQTKCWMVYPRIDLYDLQKIYDDSLVPMKTIYIMTAYVGFAMLVLCEGILPIILGWNPV